MPDSSKTYTLHPFTRIIIALELSVLVLMSPYSRAFLLIAVFFTIILFLPQRSDTRLARPCIRLLSIAALFLFLLHGITFNPFGFSENVFSIVLASFLRIVTPVTAVLYLSKTIRSEEFFALCLDFRMPPAVIMILFRTIWLVPRLMERMDEVVVAQKLRGIPIRTPYQRLLAIIPTLSTIFSSMIEETSENALVLSTRGFLLPGRKSHVTRLSFRILDVLLITLTTLLMVFLCW